MSKKSLQSTGKGKAKVYCNLKKKVAKALTYLTGACNRPNTVSEIASYLISNANRRLSNMVVDSRYPVVLLQTVQQNNSYEC